MTRNNWYCEKHATSEVMGCPSCVLEKLATAEQRIAELEADRAKRDVIVIEFVARRANDAVGRTLHPSDIRELAAQVDRSEVKIP